MKKVLSVALVSAAVLLGVSFLDVRETHGVSMTTTVHASELDDEKVTKAEIIRNLEAQIGSAKAKGVKFSPKQMSLSSYDCTTARNVCQNIWLDTGGYAWVCAMSGTGTVEQCARFGIAGYKLCVAEATEGQCGPWEPILD